MVCAYIFTCTVSFHTSSTSLSIFSIFFNKIMLFPNLYAVYQKLGKISFWIGTFKNILSCHHILEIFARTNFLALALRENRKFSHVFIFTHLQILSFSKPDIWQYKRKTGVGFANLWFIFMRESVEIQHLFSRNFAQIQVCRASARKFLRIRNPTNTTIFFLLCPQAMCSKHMHSMGR